MSGCAWKAVISDDRNERALLISQETRVLAQCWLASSTVTLERTVTDERKRNRPRRNFLESYIYVTRAHGRLSRHSDLLTSNLLTSNLLTSNL